MTKKILVSGSIANDYIMNFHDEFGNYILPEKTHQLSVSFNINELNVNAGWAGQNISYNLWLLGQKSTLLWAVGQERQASEFNKEWIDYTHTIVSEKYHTAIANILTDDKSNQINWFYPGAIFESGQAHIADVEGEIAIAIVSPNAPDTMSQHVRECNELDIPVIFDPGQPLPAFSQELLIQTLEAATYLIVNEYELELLCKIAEIQESDLIDMVQAYIVTLWAEWSRYVSRDESFAVAAQQLSNDVVLDPTWAGDSFRAGILYTLHHGLGWKEGMELGSKLAAACIQMHGTQRHSFEI